MNDLTTREKEMLSSWQLGLILGGLALSLSLYNYIRYTTGK